jgi:hypothetical protein
MPLPSSETSPDTQLRRSLGAHATVEHRLRSIRCAVRVFSHLAAPSVPESVFCFHRRPLFRQPPLLTHSTHCRRAASTRPLTEISMSFRGGSSRGGGGRGSRRGGGRGGGGGQVHWPVIILSERAAQCRTSFSSVNSRLFRNPPELLPWTEVVGPRMARARAGAPWRWWWRVPTYGA